MREGARREADAAVAAARREAADVAAGYTAVSVAAIAADVAALEGALEGVLSFEAGCGSGSPTSVTAPLSCSERGVQTEASLGFSLAAHCAPAATPTGSGAPLAPRAAVVGAAARAHSGGDDDASDDDDDGPSSSQRRVPPLETPTGDSNWRLQRRRGGGLRAASRALTGKQLKGSACRSKAQQRMMCEHIACARLEYAELKAVLKARGKQ